MKHWWQDWIVWMMAVSMTLLLYLTAIWLSNSYQRGVHQVVRDGDYLFVNAVRSLEDSLMQLSLDNRLLWDNNDSLRDRHHELRRKVGKAILFGATAEDGDSTKDRRSTFRIWRDRMKDRHVEGFVASLAFHYVTADMHFLEKNLIWLQKCLETT